LYSSTRFGPKKGEFCAAAGVLMALLLPVHASGQSAAMIAPPSAASADGYVNYATDHFRIAHHDEPAKAQLVGDVLEETYAMVDSALRGLLFEPASPAKTMDWVCFSDRSSFESYAATYDRADVSALNGYYSPRTGRVVLFWGTPSFANEFSHKPTGESVHVPASDGDGQLAGSLTAKPLLPIIVHESVHQIAYSRNLQDPGRRYPLWFTEGLALYIEHAFDFRATQHANDWRDTLVRLRDEDALLVLSEFALVGEVTYNDLQRIRPLYAQAWGAFAFLAETKPDTLIRYVDGLRASHARAPLRLDEFERAFGDIAPLEREWRDWLARLDR
jgi:hypothetical protein